MMLSTMIHPTKKYMRELSEIWSPPCLKVAKARALLMDRLAQVCKCFLVSDSISYFDRENVYNDGIEPFRPS